MKIPRRRFVAAAAIVLVGIFLLGTILSFSLTEQSAASRDFIGYWAAGQQIVHGANPYDADQVLAMEKATGLGDLQIKITPSPPVGLALVLPLGFVGAKNGLIFWMLLELACAAIALATIWALNGKPASRIHLFGFLFAPVVACLMAGQLGIFLMLGLALFLLWHEKHPFWAGAALLPMTLKPHLFLPVALALLLWTVTRRKWALVLGLFGSMAASFALVLAFDPHIWSQYLAMMHTGVMHDRFAPTLSAYLREYLAPRFVWLEYLPTSLACVWSGVYFWTRRSRWEWMQNGLLVVLIGVLCAPYAWFTDEAVLLPAVLAGVYRARSTGRSLLPIGFLAAVAVVELYANVRITAWYYTWTVPAWLAWYLYATRVPQGSSTPAHEQFASK